MISKIDICNLSLAHLGQDGISSLNQDVDRARRIHLFYEPVKAEVLRTHNWAFALVREPLVLLEDPSAPAYPYLYQYPADGLFVRKVFAGESGRKPFEFKEVYRRRINQRAIQTPAPQAVAEYTRDVQDATQFDPAFVKAFSLALAADLALTLTGDEALSRLLLTRYAQSLEEARRSNMSEEFQIPPAESVFMEAR